MSFFDSLADGPDAALSFGLDSPDHRLIIWIVSGDWLFRTSASSRGRGNGAVQSVSENEVGRPVMTASIRSIEQRAHQTRYLTSLEEFVTFFESFRRLRPRAEAWRIAIPLMAHDLKSYDVSVVLTFKVARPTD